MVCIICIPFTEAKIALLETCRQTLETIQDPEKVQGRLSKEDKVGWLRVFDSLCEKYLAFRLNQLNYMPCGTLFEPQQNKTYIT